MVPDENEPPAKKGDSFFGGNGAPASVDGIFHVKNVGQRGFCLEPGILTQILRPCSRLIDTVDGRILHHLG